MIFGIGLSRTGTRTLAAALDALGYCTLHGLRSDMNWLAPCWPRCEGFDAVVETPYSRCFAIADHAFPGSKFILTTRNKAAWLDSVHRWLHRHRPRRKSPFWEFRLLQLGCVFFNHEVLSHLYDEHHAAVQRYFAGRGGDLLRLDVTAGPCWEELAAFLEKPISHQKWPHLNEGPDRVVCPC